MQRSRMQWRVPLQKPLQTFVLAFVRGGGARAHVLGA